MTDKNDDTNLTLSRRKILGAAGTVGAAGALGGAATTGLLWDEEKFGNATDPNVLQAGTLDLKVDWEEHYSDWSGDETDGLNHDVVMTDSDPGNVPTNYVGLPDPSEPLLAVHADDLDTFMDNTAVEAYPDTDDDGVQDDFDSGNVGTFCEDGADLPEALDSDLRTESSRQDPLVNLMDVKPGDFGELTLSFHLCDNPGYVFLDGELVEAAENGTTEPEEESDDETGGENETSSDVDNAEVELLDAVQTTWWYDEDGDNVLDAGSGGGGGDEVDIVIVLDESGSMGFEAGKFQSAKDGAKALVDAVGPTAQVGLVSFNSGAFLREGLTTDKQAVKDEIDDLIAGGGTDISNAVQAGREELTGQDVNADITASGNDRDSARKVMVFLTNGSTTSSDETDAKNEANMVKNLPADLYTIAYGSSSDDQLLKDMASDPTSQFFFDAPSQSEVEQAFDDIGGQISTGGEEVIFRGSLRESLKMLESDGIVLDADRSTEEPDCFQPSSTNYVGVAWYVPRDIPGINDNSIQTDSVEFNIGFSTVQCRHNPVGNDGRPMDDSISEADSDA